MHIKKLAANPELLDKAEAGDTFYQSRIYDGSDEADESLMTTTVIGKEQSAQADDPELAKAKPLEKERFLAAFQSFKIDEGFPDAKFNYYHFRVDPFEPSRVWYDARFVGTNTGPLIGGTLPATNKKVESPPQSCSMCFNERGECTQLTVGYVMDKQLGNTGGLGGVYGILYAIGYGLPFPEAQPWQKSVQYDLFQRFSGATQELQKFVKGLTGGN